MSSRSEPLYSYIISYTYVCEYAILCLYLSPNLIFAIEIRSKIILGLQIFITNEVTIHDHISLICKHNIFDTMLYMTLLVFSI